MRLVYFLRASPHIIVIVLIIARRLFLVFGKTRNALIACSHFSITVPDIAPSQNETRFFCVMASCVMRWWCRCNDRSDIHNRLLHRKTFRERRPQQTMILQTTSGSKPRPTIYFGWRKNIERSIEVFRDAFGSHKTFILNAKSPPFEMKFRRAQKVVKDLNLRQFLFS